MSPYGKPEAEKVLCVCGEQHQVAKQQKWTRYRASNQGNVHVFELWEETAGKPPRRTKNVQTGAGPEPLKRLGCITSHTTYNTLLVSYRKAHQRTACRSCIRDLLFNPIKLPTPGFFQSASIRPTGTKDKEAVLMYLLTGEHERNEDRITFRAFIRLLW